MFLNRLLLIATVFSISLVWIATLQSEFWSFAAFYIIGFGVTNAMTYMVPVHHGWLWFPKRPGLVSGLIICGFGFGALIFNTLSQNLVNPDNESADQETGTFSEEVNKRVPGMLRTVLVCFLVMTLVAICLISKGPLPAFAQQNIDEIVLIDDLLQTQATVDEATVD